MVDQRKSYFATLSPSTVLSLLIYASSVHVDLPVFPPNVRSLLADARDGAPTASTPRSNPAEVGDESKPDSTPRLDRLEQQNVDDGYDTDPSANYPRPGHGIARLLPPESDDMQWLVERSPEVFSHRF